MSLQTVIMVAPNDAHKTKSDHAGIPLSIEDTVTEASRCYAAGVSVLHSHVRDMNHDHVLDAGLYRELIDEMAVQVPQMLMQITSEALDRYTPAEQIACVISEVRLD